MRQRSTQHRRAARSLPVLVAAMTLALPAAVQADVLTVTTTDDPATFRCPAAGDQQCSLRGALGQNDDDGGGDTVIVPSGQYDLRAPLQIEHAVSVNGAPGASAPVIDAAGGGSAVQVLPPTPSGPLVGPVSLTSLVFTGSVSSPAITADGGQSLTLTGVTVRGNSAGGLNTAVPTTIDHSRFADNIALVGGAINAAKETLDVSNSDFERNTATESGGGIAALDTERVTVIDSRFSGNFGGQGGALAVISGSAALVNTTVDGNFGDTGPAAWTKPPAGENPGGSLRLSFSTVVGQNPGAGAAIAGRLDGVQLDDTVLADNHGGSCDGPVQSLGDNLSDDHSCGLTAAGDRQDTDPQLAPVADNGGPVATALPLRTSPLLDAAASQCPTTDARGIPRPQGDGCDIGAAELQGVAPAAVTGPASAPNVTGTVNPGGQLTQVTVQFGRTAAYGSVLPLPAVHGWRAVAVSGRLPGLPAGVLVHYRIVAVNASGTSFGADSTLRLPLPPVRVSGLQVRFGRGGRSATVLWRQSAAARVRFALFSTRSRRPRWTRTVGGRSGRNAIRLPGSLLRSLHFGRYRLVLSAPAGASNTSFALHRPRG